MASAFSVVMATYHGIGRVSTWSQLVRTIESSVALFNEKMINVDDEDDENADDADATEEFPSHRKMARRGGGYSYTSLLGPGSGGRPRILGKLFSKASSSDAPPRPPERADNFAVEPRTRQWQFFGRAWNEICRTLRASDLISDSELDDLLFRFIGGLSVSQLFALRLLLHILILKFRLSVLIHIILLLFLIIILLFHRC